jgi:hypothetical protein
MRNFETFVDVKSTLQLNSHRFDVDEARKAPLPMQKATLNHIVEHLCAPASVVGSRVTVRLN